ncbi:hypothetical protein QZH41_016044 [Actinostola sp. cb2023]|nr:hypothetical protein QZH41_016044 [Actinostola sp. cb2023]
MFSCFRCSALTVKTILYDMANMVTLRAFMRFLFSIVLLEKLKSSSGSQSDAFEFPPRFVPSNDPAVPAGHLKPFGYQRPPDGPVLEYNTVLHPVEFWNQHVSQNKPAVFRQAIAKSSAILKWNDDYLKEHYGDLDVLIELKKENRSFAARRTTLQTFINNYNDRDIYVVTVLPDPMRKEIQVPSCLMCGSFVDYIHETNFWMSSGGTCSAIHFDADHILHCLIAGQKDWMLMNQEHVENLYMENRARLSGSGFTWIDADKVDMLKYPKVANVSWHYTTLYPGDCLFFPSEYIHQVRSYVRSISATMLFTTDGEFHHRGCDNVNLNANITLDKIHVHWTYNKGDSVIEMGYMNVEMLRDTMLKAMDSQKAEKLTLGLFEKFWYHSMDEDDAVNQPRQVFHNLLDKEGKGFLSREDVLKLPVDTIKEMARVMDPPHGPKKQDQLDEDEKNLDIKQLKENDVNENAEENTSHEDETKEQAHVEL